jgi:c-di-GMP-binding flagellar brake protein YcgR
MTIETIAPEDRARFRVTHAAEIEAILREVMKSKNRVTLYGSNVRQFVLSTLVAVEAERGCLQLEQGVDKAMNAALLRSDFYTFATASQDHIHIQFVGSGLTAVKQGDETLLQLPIPHELFRIQRREFFRMTTSVLHPVKCVINSRNGRFETVVVDISVGGVGVLALPELGSIVLGETFNNCRISLPGQGEYEVTLQVCTSYEVTLRNGSRKRHAGCRFMDLPPSVETAIQRYIIQMEREIRSRYT